MSFRASITPRGHTSGKQAAALPNNRQLKKTINAEESRHKRQELTVQLRAVKREESMQSKRRMFLPIGQESSVTSGHAEVDTAPHITQVMLAHYIKNLTEVHKMAMSEDVKHQLDATIILRKLLSIEKDPPAGAVIASGVVPRIMQFAVPTAAPLMQLEALWVLTNVVSSTSPEQTRELIRFGLLNAVLPLLGSPDIEVSEQAVWLLANISGENASCRNAVLRAGGMTALLPLFKPDVPVRTLRLLSWAMSNMCRNKPLPPFDLVKPALPIVAALLQQVDQEILGEASWTISFLTDDDSTRKSAHIQPILTTGLAPRLVQLLGHSSIDIRGPILRAVGNIVGGDEVETQVMIAANVLPMLKTLLHDQKRKIRKEAAWTLSNITAGTVPQIEAVIQTGLVPDLILAVRSDMFEVKKEAAWALANIISNGTEAQARGTIKEGAVPAICSMLEAPDTDAQSMALDALEGMLAIADADVQNGHSEINQVVELVEACSGHDALEVLQNTECQNVFHKVQHLLITYFDGERREDEEAMTFLREKAARSEGFVASAMGFAGADAAASSPTQFAFDFGGSSTLNQVSASASPSAFASSSMYGNTPSTASTSVSSYPAFGATPPATGIFFDFGASPSPSPQQ